VSDIRDLRYTKYVGFGVNEKSAKERQRGLMA